MKWQNFAFCLDDITDVENLQDVTILTISNFVKSRSRKKSVQLLLLLYYSYSAALMVLSDDIFFYLTI